MSRLVLSSFDPIENAKYHYEIHFDCNSYNNKLSNLKWSSIVPRWRGKKAATAMKLTTENQRVLEFRSITECYHYLRSLQLKISISLICLLCARQGTKFDTNLNIAMQENIS